MIVGCSLLSIMYLQVAADDGDALVDGQTGSLIRSIHQPVFTVNGAYMFRTA